MMLAVLVACQENESVTADFTGNETVYALFSGSTYLVSGTVTLQEKNDGSTLIRVELSGTEAGITHPVHLHPGDITLPDADIAALLNPVDGKTGISETHLKTLADEAVITYQELVKMNACIKVHLSSTGAEKDIVLAAGNIGAAASNDLSNGRSGIGVCKSE